MNTSGCIEGVHIRETMNAHGITSYNPSPGELEADQAMQKVYKSARPLGRLLGLILVNFQHITFSYNKGYTTCFLHCKVS